MSSQQLCPVLYNGESDISSYLIDEFSDFYWFNNNNNDIFYEDENENETHSVNKSDETTKHQSRKIVSKRLFSKEKILDYKLRRRASQFPRILKRDFRRQIPQMYINVLNACDHKLHKQFIHHFFWENVAYKINFKNLNSAVLEGFGRGFIVNNALLQILRYPDITFQLNEASIIRTLESDHCKLDILITTRGTRVDISEEDQKLIDQIIRNLNEHTIINLGYDFMEYDNFVYSARLSLLLDENGHIYELNVH